MSYVEYETQCGNCTYYDYQGNNSKGYCSWYKSYYYPGDSCSHQQPGRSSSESTCYITTIVCNILGYDDKCKELETLRLFRNNILQKNQKYIDLLYEYDKTGPIIAKCIYEDYKNNNERDIAVRMFNKYIKPTSNLIMNNNYKEAINKYTEMTKLLEEYYSINVESIVPNNYDFNNGGHGKVQIINFDTKKYC